MPTTPRLSIGLPVYNGERYLAEAMDALLGQTYEDFELIVSDNASTDGTPDICRTYERLDPRVRFFRQPRNVGLAPNHNFVVEQAEGELFKWASYDDLYARDLVERCVEALDAQPHVVLAHSWTAAIDPAGAVTKVFEYVLGTSGPWAPGRFQSMLYDTGGDDIYGVVRSDVLRRVLPERSHHHADRTIVTEISLHGPFHQVPDWLYFRRDHPQQAERAFQSVRARCANMDPRRADQLWHPAARLYAEYLLGYVTAIQRAPLSSADRRQCYRTLAGWAARRAQPGRPNGGGDPPLVPDVVVPVDAIVAGREKVIS
jgi:glycosyltransferase involved in cell wall biosynthesis